MATPATSTETVSLRVTAITKTSWGRPETGSQRHTERAKPGDDKDEPARGLPAIDLSELVLALCRRDEQMVLLRLHQDIDVGLHCRLGDVVFHDRLGFPARVVPLLHVHAPVTVRVETFDQFFVTETFGVSDLFSALPVRQRPGVSHTIARYRDPAMSVLLFWDAGVSFQVAGRGSLLRLDDFAQAIYTMAIYNR